ncbi:MAG: TIGR04190 family B12-binding domain/radical SAM domain protein [bacterium]|nr:TIGR04190 family B12-binding domain/radical SAM domain protein [bacterium]
MRQEADLILLHPPTVYDFREKVILFGPISDLVPSTPVFEMYPIGFTSISEYLGRFGFHVRIINIALKMLRSKRYDAEEEIKNLHPRMFGIDLHWMPHVQGSLALAEIVKKYHPTTPVIFGGLSSTYYHEELIRNYPQIDYVMRGDSTEEPLRQLLSAIKTGGPLDQIPNLTWRDSEGKVRVNPLSNIVDNLNGIKIDYSHIMKKVMRYRDLAGYTPYQKWLNYPATAVFSVRGCTHTCCICGGAAYAFRKNCNRQKPAYRDPELLAQDMKTIDHNLNAPIIIIGDMMQPGREYALRLLKALKKLKIRNPVAVEFFVPPADDILERIAEAIPNFNIEMSPESHDEEIRRTFGRPYGNEELERMIDTSLRLGCQRIDLFFMIGLSKQTYQSVLDTVDYCRLLLERFGHTKRLIPFISPYAPFIDPGSEAFENPEKFGYKILCRTVEEHRRAMENLSWKYVLSYETKWMTRSEIVDSSYEAGMILNRLKAKYGLINPKKAEQTERRMQLAVKAMKEIDEIMLLPDEAERERRLQELKTRVRKLSESTICEKKELEWPTRLLRMNIGWILKNWFQIEIWHRLLALKNRGQWSC